MINVNTGNELTNTGKITGGLLLVIFTILPAVLIVAIWPNKLPPIGSNTDMIYHWKWFNVELVKGIKSEGRYINLNSIIFLLVSFSGFLGSMIHVGTSFTNYIGADQFKRSWITWYFIKPFTATGVALILYFVLRAGLLNIGDSNNLNLYGLVTLAAFAGLFTDKATIKLEEIFTVIFKPKDERPDKLEKGKTNINLTDLDDLTIAGQNHSVVAGEGLDNQLLKLKINGVEIPDFIIKPSGISFSYKVPDDLKGQESLPLQIFDGAGKELFTKDVHFNQYDN